MTSALIALRARRRYDGGRLRGRRLRGRGLRAGLRRQRLGLRGRRRLVAATAAVVVFLLLAFLLSALVPVFVLVLPCRRCRRALAGLRLDLVRHARELLEVDVGHLPCVDRLRDGAPELAGGPRGGAGVASVEVVGDLVAEVGEVIGDRALDRRPSRLGARRAAAAAPGERRRERAATRREPDAPPTNRATPFPGSPPAFGRQGKRCVRTEPYARRGRSGRTRRADLRPEAGRRSRG